jgi:sortase B
MIKPIRVIVAAILIAVIAVGSLNLWTIHSDYAAESEAHDNAMKFKPEGHQPLRAQTPQTSKSPKSTINKNILELQREYGNAVGWLTVDGTKIDYPFAQASDNAFYLKKGLDGGYMAAGSIFMDYRNEKDFSDFNTVIYGHYMKNGSMFGTLRRFGGRKFFETNGSGSIMLSNRTYALEAFAYMVIRSDDKMIYGTLRPTADDAARVLAYIKRNARHYRAIGVTPNDRLVTLSTCAYEFDGARMVLICRLSALQ